MADFQAWDRQLLPQGGLVAPQTGPSLAESFGEGFADLATAAAGAIESVRKTDDWRNEEQWEIDRPKAAAMVAGLKEEALQRLPELKTQAESGLANYPALIHDYITRTTEQRLKGIESARFRDFVHEHMGEFRAATVGVGVLDKTSAIFGLQADALKQLMAKELHTVTQDHTQFDRSADLVVTTIEHSSAFTKDEKTRLSRDSKRSLALQMFNALSRNDPEAAKRQLESGKFSDVLTIEDVETIHADIEREQGRHALETQQQSSQQGLVLETDTNLRYSLAEEKAESTGTFDGITYDDLKRADPARAAERWGKLKATATLGLDRLQILSQPLEDDSRFLTRLRDAHLASPNDRLLAQRFNNAVAVVKAKSNALESDPGGYLLNTNSAVKEAWDAVAATPGDVDLLFEAAGLTHAALERIGLDPEKIRPVPNETAGQMLTWIRTGGGVAAITHLQKGLRRDYRSLVAQTARQASPFLFTAMLLGEPKHRAVQERLLEIDAAPDLPRNVLLTRLGGDDTELRDALNDAFGDLPRAFGTQDGVFAKIHESARALALYYMDDKFGMGLADAASRAVGELIADDYDVGFVNSGAFLVPKPYNPDEISFAAQRYAESLINKKIDKPIDARNIENEFLVQSLEGAGRWSMLPDGTGLFLHYENGAQPTIRQQPIIVSFAELQEIHDRYYPENKFFGGTSPQ